jgi:hypothetical protein
MGNMSRRLVLAGVWSIAGHAAWATDPIDARPIHFARGATSATVKGSLKGDRIVDYRLGARAGQTMTVTLKTSNPSGYFNVLEPGSKDVAVFVGSSGGDRWEGTLAADGEYTVRVYLMRNAARRNESASYTLTVGIAGGAQTSALGTAPVGDAKVRGTPYHATGQVPCSTGAAANGSAQCEFGVIRGTPGNAEVHLTRPGGLQRVLTFRGRDVSADAGSKVRAGKRGGMWSVDVDGDEHYQIPEAVISGG